MGSIRLIVVALVAVCAVTLTGAANLKSLAKAMNEFGLKLYRQQAASAGSSENIFFSPYAIGQAAGLVNLGAQGSTRSQLENALNFGSSGLGLSQVLKSLSDVVNSASNRYSVNQANNLFLKSGARVSPNFASEAQRFFSTVVRNTNFASNPNGAIAEISNWVSQNTGGKVADLADSSNVNGNTKMFLASGAAFEGGWKHIFSTRKTQKYAFYVGGSSSQRTDVDMMRYKSRKALLRYFKIPDFSCKIVEIPYLNKEVSMYILVPYSVSGLASLERDLTFKKLDYVIDRKITKHEVSLYLPKFQLATQLNLKQALQGLGVTNLFSSGTADLSGISSDRNLALSEAAHKAYIEVNEKGTSTWSDSSFPSYRKTAMVKVDRPFMFLIRERSTGAVLFMGRVTDPTGGQAPPPPVEEEEESEEKSGGSWWPW